MQFRSGVAKQKKLRRTVLTSFADSWCCSPRLDLESNRIPPRIIHKHRDARIKHNPHQVECFDRNRRPASRPALIQVLLEPCDHPANFFGLAKIGEGCDDAVYHCQFYQSPFASNEGRPCFFCHMKPSLSKS